MPRLVKDDFKHFFLLVFGCFEHRFFQQPNLSPIQETNWTVGNYPSAM
jgi:hypothetical protein